MAGYGLLVKIRRLEEECDKLGFVFCHSKYGSYRGHEEVVALKPKDQDSLPIYARDAELFCGTFDELEVWLRGVQWARDYDNMLFGAKKHTANRERKEQDYRNRKLIQILQGNTYESNSTD